MTAIEEKVFSEYEVREMKVIIGENVGTIKCIGTLEEESTVMTITKKCRGIVAKTRTRGTGSGTLNLTAHIPYALYHEMMGMKDDNLIAGVHAYGKDSLHPVCTITADVYDEDDVEKFKAWPCCTMNTGPARSVENGAEEVAEVECEIAFSPDEYGYGMYEALATDLTDDTAKSSWMDAFTPDLVRVEEV